MMSTRFAPAVLALVGLALVPTVIHSYIGDRATDPVRIDAIPAVLDGQRGIPTDRHPQWMLNHFESTNWLERRYQVPNEVTLTIIRSLDAKRLYHHPELDVAYGDAYGPVMLTHLPGREDVPVQVLPGLTDASIRAMYVLESDGQYIADPLRFQLRSAVELLFRPRKPMTLLFVREVHADTRQPIERSKSLQLLAKAVGEYEARVRATNRRDR